MNLKKIAEIITLILLVFATLTLSVLLYARFLYPDADYEQITITVEHLTPKVIFAALSLKDYILALLFFIFIYPICYFLLNKKQQLIALLFMSSLSLYLTGYPTHFILNQTKTTLYEQHYIAPKTLQLTFPKQKKNLVLIYLESFEQNFTEEKYYQKNLIPNLQKLQQKGQFVTNFSNLPGATFSVAAIVASQCGIPIRPRTQKNDLYTKSHFLPQAVCFPELLRQNGYQTALIKAADITYTDVDIFAKSHGYEKAIGFDEIIQTYPEDELESHLGTFDGINDKSLFEYAKKQLAAFNPDKPFMLTLFSLDTHGPNYFKAPSCPVVFNDERDAFLCTDKIVADFISWFKTTPYYKNTTIVILGDHLMPYALNNKTPKKRGTYNAFLNLDNSLKLDTTKTYSTYDFAPTILESLNIKLDNRAFGLGRSLFAKEPTLVEQLGFSYLKDALRQKSDTYERFQTPPQKR
ncbi:MAG: LTA synthase family protein, partial [Alphaproteobacteria bacterium]|nr:LTA synthase family protein [Alphaproteobacteria bacterium]